MESVSTRLDDETYRLIRETADERGISIAEVLRELIEKGMDYDELKRENERLRSEKRTLVNDREERTELIEYVEKQRQADRYRDRRQRKIDQANVLARAKWKLTGVPVEDE